MDSKEKVLNHAADVIRIASRQIKRDKSVKSDQMRQLTGLINAYTRLLYAEETNSPIIDPELDGDPSYHDRLEENHR